jgi:hypothetical protein
MDINFNLKFFSINRQISITRQTFQYGVGFLTILIAMIASYWGSVDVLVLVLAAIGGIVGLLALGWQPLLAYILLMPAGMFVPFSGPGGFNASILLVMMMTVLWIGNMFVVRRRFEFVRSSAVRPAVFFMIVSLVAFGMGQVSWFQFARQAPFDTQLGGFAIYFFSLAMMVMTGNIIKDIRWLKAIMYAFIGLSMVYVLGRAVLWSGIDSIYENGFVANSMLWTWLVILPLAQVLFNHELKPRSRALLFVAVALTLYVAVVQTNDWKSGWVPAMVGVGVLLAFRFPKLAVAAVPFALIGVVYLAQDLISTDQYSWGTRVDAWIVVLEISRANPILGLGFANYNWYAPLFPLRGYYIRFNSHSQFVDIIAQTGLAGLICFLWILYEVGTLGWRLSRQLKDGFARAYAYGVLAGVAACLMAAYLVDWLLPFAYNIGLNGFRASILPWIFFGGLIALEQMQKDNKLS